jgi:tetratricopeptide (TPR) repeat protein
MAAGLRGDASAGVSGFTLPSLAWFFVLQASTLAAYRPAWHGGLLWDDAAHLTTEMLQSWEGLVRLWVDVAATQQYYPVVNSAFWLMAKLWGHETFGYHLVNITLHATSAFLVALILRRLEVRGAWLTAVIFALHPVHVESVAWMSELKNTLSGVCYLSAALTYLRFDRTRSRATYALALVFFALALGSKTVTATFPAAMLVILWWWRGRIETSRDVIPLVPFFALGLLAGVGTAWVEYHLVGASGSEFALGPLERVLLAGRVVWFYVTNLVWPANLMFSYPRWTIDTGAWWQYLFPLALAAVVGVFFVLRNRTRAPLAAALFFIGTLFPALGFVNVYPFRYSFVADHFQYLASLGVIASLAAGLTLLVERWRPRTSQVVLAILIGSPLALLTHAQSRQYVDAETLYRTTIDRNPESSLARTNLAALLLEGPASGWAEAIDHAQAVLRIDPRRVAAHNLLGVGLQKTGHPEQAAREFRTAIQLDPDLAESHYNLGLAENELGHFEQAVSAYEEALRIFPRDVKTLHNLATVLRRLKRYDEALVRLRTARSIDPDSPDVQLNLAVTLQASGATDAAIAAYTDMLRRWPDWGEAWGDLGQTLNGAGRTNEAIDAFQHAVRLLPRAAVVRVNLAAVLINAGRLEEAVPQLEQAIASTDPAQTATLHDDVGQVLLRLGRKDAAIAHFETAVSLRPDFALAREHLAQAKRGK